MAVQSGLTEAEAQDVVQDTIISLARSMGRYEYDPAMCSFRSWLRHIAHKRIIAQFRKRTPVSLPPPDDGSSGTEFIARIPDPQIPDLETVWDKE